MIQTSWKIESAWKVEPVVHPNEAGWTLVETWERDLYDDYEGEELAIIPPSPHPLSCGCGGTEFYAYFKRYEHDIVNEDGEFIDSADSDSSSDYESYECAECGAEITWRN